MKRQIVIDGKTYEVEFDTAEDHAQSIVLPSPPSPGAPGSASVDESKVCRSPVAGIVTRINVEPGQSVKPGETILVVEAMKMENNLTAASPAKVNSINVKVGDSVKAGQAMVEFE